MICVALNLDPACAMMTYTKVTNSAKNFDDIDRAISAVALLEKDEEDNMQLENKDNVIARDGTEIQMKPCLHAAHEVWLNHLISN